LDDTRCGFEVIIPSGTYFYPVSARPRQSRKGAENETRNSLEILLDYSRNRERPVVRRADEE